MVHSCYFCLVFVICFRVRLFIDALWPPAGKGLTSWISFVMSNCEHWYPGSVVSIPNPCPLFCFLYDLMNYIEEENIPGFLSVVDFEKAFNSISWDFIGEVLEFFKFGSSMIKWISVLYNNISSAVTQCGFLSDFFLIYAEVETM